MFTRRDDKGDKSPVIRVLEFNRHIFPINTSLPPNVIEGVVQDCCLTLGMNGECMACSCTSIVTDSSSAGNDLYGLFWKGRGKSCSPNGWCSSMIVCGSRIVLIITIWNVQVSLDSCHSDGKHNCQKSKNKNNVTRFDFFKKETSKKHACKSSDTDKPPRKGKFF